MEFKYFIRIILRRKRIFAAIFLITILVPLIIYSLGKDIYKSSARIMIQRTDIFSDLSSILPTTAGQLNYLDSDSYYAGYLELLKDDALLQQVIKNLNIDVEPTSFCTDYPYLKFMAFLQDKAVRVKRIEESDVFEITAYSPSIQEAEKMANLQLELFLGECAKLKREIARKAKSLFEKKREEIKAQLLAAERKKEMFIALEGITSFEIQLRDLYEKVSSYEYDLDKTRAKLESLEKTQLSIKNALGKTPEFLSGVLSTAISDAKSRLVELEQSLAGKEAELRADHPDIISLKDQIKSVQESLKREKVKIFFSEETQRNDYFDKLYQRYWDNEIEKVLNEVSREITKRRIELLKKEIMDVATKNIEFGRIGEEVARLKEYLKSNQQSIEAAKLLEEMDINNAKVVRYADQGRDGGKAYFPNRKKMTIISIFVGFAFAFFVTLFLEYLDESCKSSSELERLTNFPVMFSMPDIQGLELCSAVLDGDSPELSESIWNLWSAFKLSGLKTSPKVVAVTSSIPGEGKTTVSTFLAKAFASSGEKTLLIEANMKRPILADICNKDINYTLDLLLQDLTSFRQAAVEIGPNLDLVAARRVGESIKLLTSGQMAAFLESVKEEGIYSRIVIDSPSFDDANSALAISSYADAVIMVTAIGKTDSRIVKESFKKLKAQKDNSQIRSVANKCT